MAAVGYHRAPRSAGATWMRIVLALALVIPALASVPWIAAAVPSGTTAGLLSDLEPNTGSSTAGDVPPVVSGGRYFFVATTVAEGIALWVSGGLPGDASVVEVNSMTDIDPYALTAFDGGILFFADAGGGYELFWTDGTTTVHPEPSGAGVNKAFFDVSGSIVKIGSDAYFTGAKNIGATMSPSSIWKIAPPIASYTVTDLATWAGFPAAPAVTGVGNTPVDNNTILGVFGTKLYAGLDDCYNANSDAGYDCSTDAPTKHGLEPWVVDTSGSPTWSLLKDITSGTDGSVGAIVPMGNVATRFFFEYSAGAIPDVDTGAGPEIWRSDGTGPNTGNVMYVGGVGNGAAEDALGIGEDRYGLPLTQAATMNGTEYLFFTINFPNGSTRLQAVAASGVPQDAAFSWNSPLSSTDCMNELVAVGSTIFFDCYSGGLGGYGAELAQVTLEGGGGGGASWTPALVKDYECPSGGTVCDETDNDFSVGIAPDSLAALGGALYFAADDPASLGEAAYAATADRELFKYTPGDPGVTRVLDINVDVRAAGFTYSSSPSATATVGGRLLFWADNGDVGSEPWVFGANDATLIVQGGGAGTGGGTVTGVGALNCVIANGTGSGTCSVDSLSDSTVTLSAVPGTLLSMRSWSGATCLEGTQAAPTCTFTLASGTTTVTAQFGTTRTLTVVPDGGSGEVDGLSIAACTESSGSVAGDCTGSYGQGATIVLTASNYSPRSLRWASGCTSNPTASTCSITFGVSNVTVSILFGYSVTVTVVDAGSTGSTVAATTPASGISNCTSSGGAGCTAVYAEPGNVELTAAPSGATVAWSVVTCNEGSQTGNVCTFSMTGGAKTPTVTFTPTGGGGADTWDLTVTKDNSASGSGTVTSNTGIRCGASCPSGSSFALADETDVVLTAKAAKGSIFTGWDGVECDEPSQTGSTCSFTLSDADETDVTAAFELLRKLTVTKTGAGAASATIVSSAEDFALGSISCGSACSASYADGTEVVLTAYLGTGSTVVTWTGCTSSDATTCTVNMLSGAKTVTVEISGPTGGPYYSLAIVNRTGLTITSDTTPALNCGPTCSVSVVGGSVTLTITEVPTGSQPTGSGLTWTQSGMTSTWTVTFTLSANTTIRVRLARI